jgi:opacity protein-like surface antigen
MEEDVEVSFLQQSVDLKSGRHVYAGIGFVRSIGDKFALGFRLRGHLSELESTVDCLFESTCKNPSGTLRAATVEGRIILTSLDWIDPYLLVGIGVVQTSVDGVTLQGVNSGSERTERGVVSPDIPEDQEDNVAFSEVSIVDAGGDVGLGAAFPLTRGLSADVEFRVAGSLPGGKENAVTVLPLTLGVSYTFE